VELKRNVARENAERGGASAHDAEDR